MMDETRDGDTGRLATAAGAVAIGSAVCLAGMFTLGQPFGTINDLGNATTGILTGWLAWRLRGQVPGRAGATAVAAALGGAAVSTVGSSLVLSGTTGFLFAGLVSSVGFAGIGAWLVALSRSAAADRWPPRQRLLGVAAGALLALGIATAPGIPLRLDDLATAPAWIWIGFLSWIGIYAVYPSWAIWFGLVQSRRTVRAGSVQAATAAAE